MRNIKIRSKLFIGFAVVLAITAIIAIFAGNRISHVDSQYSYVLSYPLERFDIMHQLAWNLNESRRIVNRTVMYIFVPERIETGIPARVAALEANHESSHNLIQAYIANLHSDPDIEPARRNYLLGVIADYQAAIDRYADYYLVRVFAAIRTLDGPAAMAAVDAVSGQIAIATEFYNYMMTSAEDYMNSISGELSAQTSFTITLVIIITVAGVLIGAAIALYIANVITKPIHEVSHVIESVSKGNLEINMRDNLSRDEVGVMTQNTYNMAKTIRGMVDDIAKFAYEGKVNGDIEYRIDASKYTGAYKEMLDSLAEFTDDFTDGVLMLLNAMGEVNNGNFNVKLPRVLPGKKIVLNQTADALIANVAAVRAELGAMIDSVANKGDLTFQIEAAKYNGEWRDIMIGLNDIAKAVDMPIKVINATIEEMRVGNFDVAAMVASQTAAGLVTDPEKHNGVFKHIIISIDETLEEIASYIKEISDTSRALASGDLTTSIQREFVGSFNAIKESLNNISSTLNKTMSEIAVASEQVLSGAKQISSSAQNLANGAQEQASSIEELNASIDIINQQTQQNATSAATASDLSRKSTENANAGAQTMTQMLDAMEQIKDSSNEISKIIKSIEDITFQTNLLSLNASVEAARAGEHGRGFAVVADEVRNLASKSQQSTVETTSLIGDSISRVDAGSSIAAATSESLAVIVKNANEILEIIDAISVSSKEQAESIQQVSQGLVQISSVVQSNSAVSEEAAAASQELNSQAEVLQQLVAYFKL